MAQMYEGRQVRVGVKLETAAFGTRIVDAGTFTEIRTEPAELDLDVKVDTIPMSGGNRAPILDSILTYAEGSLPSIKTSGPFSIYEDDVVFACALQKVVEGANTPFKKVFTVATDMPNFAGVTPGTTTWTATVIKRFPVASTSVALTSAVVESFKISCERGTYLKMDTTWKSVFPAALTANPSGTWERNLDKPGGTDAAATKYGMKFFSGATNYGITAAHVAISGAADADLTIQSFGVEYNQEVSGEEIAAGVFGNVSLTNVGGKIELKILKDAVFETLQTAFTAGSSIKVTLNWGPAGATADRDLEIIAYGKITSVKIEEDGILGATIQADMVAPAAGTSMLQITMANLSHRTWPEA